MNAEKTKQVKTQAQEPTQGQILTEQELFELGIAYGSFSVNDIDQGIHCILPTTDGENAVFEDLFKMFEERKCTTDGKDYLRAIRDWCRIKGILTEWLKPWNESVYDA